MLPKYLLRPKLSPSVSCRLPGCFALSPATVIRSGSAFGPKLAVFVYPVEPDSLPPERRAQLEGRATQARLSLTRAGWDCLVLPPSVRLRDRWHVPKERLLARSV